MENVELLLSEEFLEFSGKIGAIFADKKAKTADFKAIHEAWKTEMARLDQDAKEAQDAWEVWKQEHGVKK